MKNILGFDSKRFVRGKFQALLGVGITVKENKLEDFTKTYDSFMETLFADANIPLRRPIYKSYDLKRLFYAQGKTPLQNFVEATKDKLDFIDVYYSYFKNKRMLQSDVETKDGPTEFIDIYYKEPSGKKTVNAIKFLDIIEPGYPAVCCWAHATKNERLINNTVLFVDHFQPYPSKMWAELNNLKNVHIVYNGGKCNYLISAADIYLPGWRK